MAGGGAVLFRPSQGASKGPFIPRPFIYAFCLVTSLFFLWGFAYGLLDVLNKHFQTVLGISKLQSTGLQVAYFGGGYFCFSPFAGEVMRRKGYKFTIIMGLSLYSLGSILFWPCAKFSSTGSPSSVFGGFVVCTLVTACGLATLETAANSYISVLGPASGGPFRLQLSQSFNGVASFSGPLIASKYFFSGSNANNLTNVQWVYLAVSLMGVVVALLFVAYKLPEVSEADLQQAVEDDSAEIAAKNNQPIWKQYRVLFGFLAQFCYSGSQVTIGSFFINYLAEQTTFPDSQSSNMLSYALIMFTVARFFGTALLTFISAPLILGIYAVICCGLQLGVSIAPFGMSGVTCLMLTMFFESIMYPIIFVISTEGVGRHTRRAASILVMGVGGGAVFPPIQGAIADAHNTKISYIINVPSFIYIATFAFVLWWRAGHKFRADKEHGRDEVTMKQASIEEHAIGTPTSELAKPELAMPSSDDEFSKGNFAEIERAPVGKLGY